jgi:asparaginyl-tRNA synthetase
MASRFYISDAEKHDGQVVTVKGWVTHLRSSGKIKFATLRDGTGLIQSVFFKAECPEAAFTDFDRLTQETSVEVTGKLRREPRARALAAGRPARDAARRERHAAARGGAARGE